MFEQDLYQIARKWMVAPFTKFYGKIWVSFCLSTEKRFVLEDILRSRERAWILVKTVLGIFKVALHLRDRHVFMWRPLEILDVFTTLYLKLSFWKTKTFFKKLKYHFLVWSTNIESAKFLHKTALSEANVRAGGAGSTKWTYHKGQSFSSNYGIFLKILFQSTNSSKELIRCTNYPNGHVHTFYKRWSFIWRCFSLWVS